MTIVIDGSNLTVEKVVQVARHNEEIKLHPDALKRIKKCRDLLEKKIKSKEIMYGVNTGIGEFSEVVLTGDQIQQFQKYLQKFHQNYKEQLIKLEMLCFAATKKLFKNSVKIIPRCQLIFLGKVSELYLMSL